MQGFKIFIAAEGEVYPAELTPFQKEGKGITIKSVLIKQGATEGGRTGVTFCLEDEEGKKYYAISTARLIVNGLAASIKGAAARFADDLNQA